MVLSEKLEQSLFPRWRRLPVCALRSNKHNPVAGDCKSERTGIVPQDFTPKKRSNQKLSDYL
jgi:hypothetical protein